jgi:hypothetical protein
MGDDLTKPGRSAMFRPLSDARRDGTTEDGPASGAQAVEARCGESSRLCVTGGHRLVTARASAHNGVGPGE